MKQNNTMKWHKWPDEKPDLYTECIVQCEDYIGMAVLCKGNIWYDNLNMLLDDVKAWMNLPEPYKG